MPFEKEKHSSYQRGFKLAVGLSLENTIYQRQLAQWNVVSFIIVINISKKHWRIWTKKDKLSIYNSNMIKLKRILYWKPGFAPVIRKRSCRQKYRMTERTPTNIIVFFLLLLSMPLTLIRILLVLTPLHALTFYSSCPHFADRKKWHRDRQSQSWG